MTKDEAIAYILSSLERFSDEQVEILAAVTTAWVEQQNTSVSTAG